MVCVNTIFMHQSEGKNEIYGARQIEELRIGVGGLKWSHAHKRVDVV